MKTKIIAVLLGIVLLAGCQTTGGPKQTAGTFIGAASGAVIGSQFGGGSGQLVGVALGTFLGAQLGAEIGRQMDEKDKQLASRAAHDALENTPDHQTSTWKNPNNNHSGKVTITKTDEFPSENQVCRDYVQTVIIDGKEEQVAGRACRDVRDPKAQWFVQS